MAVARWDVAQPAQPAALGTLDGHHTAAVHALATHWDSSVLWSGSHDGTARLWRLRNLPHQQLAGALMAADVGRATELVTRGVVIPPHRWDDSLAADKAVSANQLLTDVLRTVKVRVGLGFQDVVRASGWSHPNPHRHGADQGPNPQKGESEHVCISHAGQACWFVSSQRSR